MSGRPYFSSSITELEELFEASKNRPQVLQALRAELKYRHTNRAKVLERRVEQQLTVAVSSAAAREPPAAGDTPHPSSSGSAVAEKQDRNKAVATPPPRSKTATLEVDTSARGHGDGSTPLDDSSRVGTQSTTTAGRSAHNGPTVSFETATPQLATDVQTLPGPDSVLAAWLTLEILTPQPLPDARELESIGRQLVRIEEYPEPWREQRFWKRGKERAVYWMVYLGELDLAKAVAAILKMYPDDAADERAEIRGTTTLAVMVVDGRGRPVEDKTFLSSFAWGYGQVRGDRLKGLANFAEAERAIKVELEKRLIRQDEDGNVLPLTAADIEQGISWLTTVLNLPEDEVRRPGVAVRVPQWGGYIEAPEPELLNSFLIGDLVKVRAAFRNGTVGRALSAYMAAAATRERQDVVRDKRIVSTTVAPARMPLTRWPGPGRYPLVLMQQAAINHAVEELENGGIVAVNGPPGTGKTTLLRDIVAKVVLDRAIAMSKFERPEQAFTHVTSMRTGQAFTHLYNLHDGLIGHEIVVASSNNKPVENISREIPANSSIADDFDPPIRYFQAISDAIAGGKGPIADGATWGLAAAVLGNSANRSAFIQSFWWHKKRGMARYLKAVTGNESPDEDEEEGEETDEQRISDVITLEQPPRSEIEALARWKAARRDFLAKLKAVNALQSQAQAGYEAVRQRPEATRQVDDAAQALAIEKEKLASAEQKEGTAKQLHVKALDVERKVSDDRAAIDRMRPGFFAQLFWTRSFREWRQQMATAVEAVKRARALVSTAADSLQRTAQEVLVARQRLGRAEVTYAQAHGALAAIAATIEVGKMQIGVNFADESFWSQDDNAMQLKSPWVFKELQQARDTLFVAAFQLHRAFIDASAKYLRHNLRGALDVMKGRALKEQQEPARRSLWASLFLVVPVVSTTFASTARLFGPLSREQLGWLLIDEAGQTVPQAAVGALWRAKRAIVIGDPLQIPPVVTTPPKLIRSIFSEFGVETEKWAGPEMSARTLADRVSWFGTSIQTDDGDIWVGSPLRVHRRCENPMFKISNHVAYNGLMVYGTPPGPSQIGEVLGESHWINVEGDAVGKWCEAEGDMAVQFLWKLLGAGIEDPDIFFITPFRIVADNLRKMMKNDRSIAERLPVRAWEWASNRVGTVHTFQGKEADAVVLVLGAPHETSAGARRWAGHPSNLLNVAVTRAKRRLYVIGNRAAWRNAGVFSHLAQMLPDGR